MKKLFLTGSSSYLGSRFIELYGEQFNICGLSRQDTEEPCDLKDFGEVKKRFEKFQPDLIIHLAADLGRDASTGESILETNPKITKNLVDLAASRNIPFIFTSTEAIYGGKEEKGGYVESDPPKPRSPYGESKVFSEKLIMISGLPYLITRSHRYVGINTKYDRPKQFLNAMASLINGEVVHLDSKKIFTPTHIDHICEVFVYYIEHHLNEKITINIGTGNPVTYFDFMTDITNGLNIDQSLIQPDGEESGWPQNSSLSMNKLRELKFPYTNYEDLIDRIVVDFKNPSSRNKTSEYSL